MSTRAGTPRLASSLRRSRLESAASASQAERSGVEASRIASYAARLFFLVVALACVSGGYWLVGDPRFRVRQVEVRGAYFLDRDSVAQQTGVLGLPIWSVSVDTARARVLALGVARDATVSFRTPDTVVVSLRERTSVYAWVVGPATYGVSEDGVILGPSDGVGQRVAIADLDAAAIHPGDRVDPAILREADYFATNLPRFIGVSSVAAEYSRANGLVLHLASGIEITPGDDQRLSDKLMAIAEIWPAALTQLPRPRVIDVQVPARPVIH
jgi:cell division septal protein FtsQ